MRPNKDPKLFLTPKTFIALTQGALVFSLVHKDKYYCLEPKYTRPVGTLFGLDIGERNPEFPDIDTDEEFKLEVDREIEKMVGAGAMTFDPAQGKRASFIPEQINIREMLGYIPGEGPKTRFHHLYNFFIARAVTGHLLRSVAMEKIHARIEERRLRATSRDARPPSYEEVNKLVEVYKGLKPLFVTVKDNCVFNSLFLIEFLARYEAYPNWFFAVRLKEFYAHCWVQGGNVIYDDTISSTSQNKPIMVV